MYDILEYYTFIIIEVLLKKKPPKPTESHISKIELWNVEVESGTNNATPKTEDMNHQKAWNKKTTTVILGFLK